MPDNNTESFDNPQVQQEHASYSLHGDVAHMRDLLEKCDNPIALAEASIQIREVIGDLNSLSNWLDNKIGTLYYPAKLIEVAV